MTACRESSTTYEGGSAGGLAPHCRQLAARGIFAVSAGYRLLGQGAVRIDDPRALVDHQYIAAEVLREWDERHREGLGRVLPIM